MTAAPAVTATKSPLRGVLFYGVALLLFACQDTATKYLTAFYPVPLIASVRYTVQLLLMTALLLPTVGRRVASTGRPVPVIARSLCLVAGTLCVGLALRRLPVAETAAIVSTAPLLVVLLAGPLLGERLTPGRAALALLGFGGVLLIARPTGDLDPLGVLFALLCAVATAAYQLMSRTLSAEPPLNLLYNSALVGAVAFGLTVPFSLGAGVAPTPLHVGLFLGLGLVAGLGHFFLTLGFRYAPASLLAPVTYLQLLWAALLGWLVFRHIPDALSLCGMAVIAASGIATVLAGGRRQPAADPPSPTPRTMGRR